jgi:phosphonate transport system permease protein
MNKKYSSIFALFLYFKEYGVYYLLLLIIIWSFLTTDLSYREILPSIKRGWNFITRLFPPDFSTLQDISPDLFSTIRMSVIGTLLGSFFAFPFAFFATRLKGIKNVFSFPLRMFLGMLRTIPILIYAIIIVTAVGFGERAGIVALGIVSFGIITKILYENIENLDSGPIEAVKSAGGDIIHIFRYAILPQALPYFFSAALYAWEINLRSAFILGLVGAGGIGFTLITYIRLFELQKVSMIIISLIILVGSVDLMSYLIRKKIL